MNNYTLVQRLEALNQIKRLEDAAGVVLSQPRVDVRRTEIIREFYFEDNFAEKVAHSKSSYVEEIEKIERRYTGFLKSRLIGDKDPLMDRRLTNVVDSMRRVGSYHFDLEVPACLESEKRGKLIKKSLAKSASVGASLTVASYLLAGYADDFSVLEKASFAVGVGLTLAGLRSWGFADESKEALARLREAAIKNETFLRINRV